MTERTDVQEYWKVMIVPMELRIMRKRIKGRPLLLYSRLQEIPQPLVGLHVRSTI